MPKAKKIKNQFKAFAVLFTGVVPTVATEILVFEPFVDDAAEATAKKTKIIATWDTGATNTCLHQRVIDKLGLIPSGTSEIQTAGGIKTVNTYLVNIMLPNQVGIAGVMVAGLPDLMNTECLLGMDVISRGDFTITNYGGKTCFTFRIPSTERTDYVYEFNKQIFGSVKPHEPCPCGAKKTDGVYKTFRQCHMPMFHPISDDDRTVFFPESKN